MTCGLLFFNDSSVASGCYPPLARESCVSDPMADGCRNRPCWMGYGCEQGVDCSPELTNLTEGGRRCLGRCLDDDDCGAEERCYLDAPARVFDDDFLLLPHGIGRRALTSATAATRDRFDLLAVDDVTAVGPIVAVRARVRWSAPTPPWRSPVTSATDVVVDDWPVVAFFRRHEVGLRAIWFGPEPQSDRGTLLRDRYRYEPMDLSIDVPPSVSVMRDRGQAAEVQVVLRPRVANLDGAWVQVLGYRTADGEIGGDPLHRLTMGEAFAPGARQLRSAERSPQRNDVTDWVFAPASGPVRRERWRRIDVGSRWRFLVRCCVRAGSDTEAVAVFERPDVQEFFAAVMAGIHPGGG